MKKKIIYLIPLLLVYSTYLLAQSNIADSISIRVHLKANSRLQLRYLNEYLIEQVLVFRNNSIKDSTLLKKISSKKSLEFRYALIDIDNKKNYYYNFVLSPGDDFSIKLQDSFDIISLNPNHKLVFANKELELINIFDLKQEDYITKAINSGIDKYDTYLTAKYNTNLKKIDSIAKLNLITDQTEKSWRNLILIDYYRQLFYPIWATHSTAEKSKDFKQKTRNTEEKLNQLQSVNSYALKELYNSLIKYNTISLGKTNDLNFQLQYIINSNWDSEVIIGSLIEKFDTYPEKNSIGFKKSFEEFKNFCRQNGKEEIATKLSSKYYPAAAIYNKIHLVNASGNSSTLTEILKKEKGKIIFIDLWASWCKPCRAELPLLEKIKKKFSTQHIEFISISLDKNAAKKAWETAMKQENLIDPSQYRMLDLSNPDLYKAFQVESIPRYLVFDRKGDVLNDNFIKPSNEQFENQLRNYLKL